MRATWVETTRSVGAWKLPTLSAREWRSATLATLGANGSWTWQMSMPPWSNSSSIVRATSIGTAAPARVRPGSGGSASPTASTRGEPSSDRSSPAWTAAPALAHEVLRARRRDDQDAVPTGGELVADAANLLVDLVPGLPRVRGDVGDGVRPGHRRAA